jgi:hypothetical protein
LSRAARGATPLEGRFAVLGPRLIAVFVVLAVAACSLVGCGRNDDKQSSEDSMKIIFLHHSTGGKIWNGGIKKWLKKYNKNSGTDYEIVEVEFPARSPYGWSNYPYDYWNIWVNNAGNQEYKREPTLELLAPEYDMVVFKHCYPVSNIQPDIGEAAVDSPEKRLENYMLQYNALKEKMHQFPDTKFLVWTGAAQVRAKTSEDQATRARAFFEWVKTEWDEPGDNIFVWDFFELATKGGLYLAEEYADGPRNSHPNKKFAKLAAPELCQRMVDVIEGRTDDR